jgi:hypothetical protein
MMKYEFEVLGFVISIRDELHCSAIDSQVRALSYIFLYGALPIEIILVTSIAFLPRSTLARLILFGTLTALTLNAFRYATGVPAIDYALGSALTTQLFASLNLICLTNPLDEYRHKSDVITPREMGVGRRMWWAFCAVHSLRGVGWNYRVSVQLQAMRDGEC